MTTTYSFNRALALACGLAVSLWALGALGTAIMVGRQPETALMIFAALVIIAWILMPLYVRQVRPAYLVGVILQIIALVGLAIMPGTPPWYTFSAPVYNFSFVVYYLVALGTIYFSYASYKERG